MVVATLSVLSVCGVVFTYIVCYLFHGRVVRCTSTRRLDGRTVIITGGSSGIGKATAVDLASRGARVIVAGRQACKGHGAVDYIREQSNNYNVRYIPLDLGDTNSIREFASVIYSSEERLDILINNAAIAYHCSATTRDGYDALFGTNYIGHFLLTYLLLDLLRRSAPSRIVNVASMSHAFVTEPLNYTVSEKYYGNKLYPYLVGYENSKLALVMHAKELARRLGDDNVTANSCHPGMVMTTLWKGTEALVGGWLFNIIKLILRPMMMSPHDAAQTVIYCAVSEDLEHVTGKYIKACALARESRYAQDPSLSEELWKISLFLTGCKPGMEVTDLLNKRIDPRLIRNTERELDWWEIPGVTKKDADPSEDLKITRG